MKYCFPMKAIEHLTTMRLFQQIHISELVSGCGVVITCLIYHVDFGSVPYIIVIVPPQAMAKHWLPKVQLKMCRPLFLGRQEPVHSMQTMISWIQHDVSKDM